MKPFSTACLVFALLASTVVHAGQIYGTIVSDGQGLKGAAIEIQCEKEAAVDGIDRGRRFLSDQRAAPGTVHARAAVV